MICLLFLSAILFSENGFEEVTDLQRDRYDRMIDLMQVYEAGLGRFSVLASGEQMVFSENNSAMFGIRFRFSRNERDEERWSANSQQLVAGLSSNEIKSGMQELTGSEFDFIKKGKTSFFRGANDVIEETESVKDPMSNLVAFHPFMALTSSSPQLQSMRRYYPKSFYRKNLTRFKELKGSDFSAILEVSGIVPIVRRFDIVDDVPVRRIDTWKNPKLEILNDVQVEWKKENGRVIPVKIHILEQQNGIETTFDFKLAWKFDKEVKSELFDLDSLGDFSLSENN